MTDTAQHRLHALDAIRAIALLLGIVLHATMSFQIGLTGEGGWPIADSSPSQTLDITFYVIHVFRMSVFFFVAGFFAHLTFHRRGMRDFFRDRSKRILLPLVIFWPICISSIGLVLYWAVVKNSGGDVSGSAAPPVGEAYFPLTHLWFLYILIWLYALTIFGRELVVRVDSNGKLHSIVDALLSRLTNSYLLTPILAVPIVIALNQIGEWLWWGGIPTPDQSYIPVWPSLLIYLYIFTLGWLFDRQRELLNALKQKWAFHVILGLVLIVTCMSIAGFESNYLAVTDQQPKLTYAIFYGWAVTATTFGFIGAGMRFFDSENPRIRYLADASYWIYLLHLSIVMALQTLLMDAPLHWLIKFALINVLTFVPLIYTYKWFVRTSWLGAILNGKRLPAT